MVLALAQAAAVFITKHLETFKEFPPRQEAPSFNIDKLIAQMNKAQDGSMH